MGLLASVVLPSPVFLLPGSTGAAVVEPGLRDACVAALRWACTDAEAVTVIADEHETGAPRPPAARTPGRRWEPPLGHQVARMLLADADWDGPTNDVTTSAEWNAQACARVGAGVVDGVGVEPARTALVVMGDFSACARPDAPAWFDPSAISYDEAAERALLAGDPEALLALDPEAGRRYLVSGRAPWQAMAGAWLAAGGGHRRAAVEWSAEPFDVTYLVARFSEAGPTAVDDSIQTRPTA